VWARRAVDEVIAAARDRGLIDDPEVLAELGRLSARAEAVRIAAGPRDAPPPYDVVASNGTGTRCTRDSSAENGRPKIPEPGCAAASGSKVVMAAVNVERAASGRSSRDQARSGSPETGLWKCASWMGTTCSRMCCSTRAGEPKASTFRMMSFG